MSSLTLTWMFLTCVSPQATRAVEGLMNGDFYDTSLYGTIGTTATAADGLYWVGAEGRTVLEGNNRYLKLNGTGSGVTNIQNRVVYQRMGAPADFTDQATMSFKVRLPNSTDEAWVTFAEAGNIIAANRDYWQLITCCRVADDPQGADWHFEYESSPGTFSAMQQLPPASNQTGWVDNTTSPTIQVLPESTFIDVNSSFLTRRVRAHWTAPQTGMIRIATRLAQQQPAFTQARAPFLHRLYKNGVLQREVSSIAANDFNGMTLVNRLSVTAGDDVYFETGRTASAPNDYVVSDWDHVISYEGRRVTYRLVRTTSANPPAEQGQAIIRTVIANSNAWATVSGLNPGTDFVNQFGSKARPPLELILSVPSGKIADFDNESCLVRYPSVTAAQLRSQILTFTGWVRTTRGLIQDKVGAGIRGTLESPYYCRKLQVHSNTFVPGSSIGLIPEDHALRLPHAFDSTDYLDQMTMHQDLLGTLLKSTAIASPYSEFDCASDHYTGLDTFPTGYTFGLADGAAAAGRWTQTGDVQSLDLAFAMAQQGDKNGRLIDNGCAVLPWSAFDDLIVDGDYDGVSGDNTTVKTLNNSCLSPGIASDEVTGGIGSLAIVYAACRRYNDLHPTPPLRYDTTKLASILQDVTDATTRVASVKNYAWYIPLATFAGFVPGWQGRWQNIAGVFNDNYSYVCGPLVAAYPAFEALPNRTTAENQALQAMRNLVEDGANFFLPLWDQQISRGGLTGGDQGKAWGVLDVLCNDTNYTPTNQAALRTTMTRAAKHLLKFQHRSGAWIAANEDWSQFPDVAGYAGAPTPPPAWLLRCLANAIQIPTINSTTRDDLICAVSAIISAADKSFRTDWYYEPIPGGTQYPYINGFARTPKESHVAAAVSANPPFIGVEKRVSDNLYVALSAMENLLGLEKAPTVSISPAIPVAAPPANGFQTFQVTITLPAGVTYTLTQLDSLINTRTFLNAWPHYLPSNGYNPFTERLQVWPPIVGSFPVTRQNLMSGPNYIGAILSFDVYSPGPKGYPRFKIEGTAASPDGFSSTAESHQQW